MDPRITPPESRKHKQSALMQAISKSSGGEKPNFCPYGCQGEDLDEHGYCYHLVGFTKATPQQAKSGKALMEPVRRRGSFEGSHKFVDGSDKEKVLHTDHLEQIVDSYRVYRDMPKPKTAAPRNEDFTPAEADDDTSEFLSPELTDADLEALTAPVPSL